MKNSTPAFKHSSKESATFKKPKNGILQSKKQNGSFSSDRHIELDFEESKEFLTVLTEVKNGNFSVRMPIDKSGIHGKIYDTLNEIISLNEDLMLEFTRAG